MKKLIAILIIFFISITAVPKLAKAQNATYAMVITDKAYLYADGSGSVVKYILPKSYFVFVKDSFGELARVSTMQGFSDCPEVEGYVKLVDLKFYTEPPQTPYLNFSLTSNSDEVLFSDSNATKPKTVIAKGSQAKYYGEYFLNSQKYYYVYANGYIGYVRSTCFDEPLIALHPEYIKLVEKPTLSESEENYSSPPSKSEQSQNSFDTNNIIVIALILICGLCVLYFIFKPEKLNSKSVYKDDE